MKLPIVDAIKTTETGKRVAITPRLDYLQTLSDIKPAINYAYEIETSFSGSIKAFVSHEVSTEAYDLIKKESKAALVKDIYGPVVDRLREIQYEAWKNNYNYEQDGILDLINNLIQDLKVD